MTDMTDLAAFDTAATADQGAVMPLVHPVSGEPILQPDGRPITLTLLGKDSKKYLAAVRAATNKRLAARKTKVTAEEIEEETIVGLVAATVAWDGVMWDGEGRDCTPVNVRAFYKRFRAFREAAVDFLEDRSNFLPGTR